MITLINWGDPEEIKRLHRELGEEKFNEVYKAYAIKAALTTVCGHRIVPLYDRAGEVSSFHVMNTVHTFGNLNEAVNYARSYPN